MTSALVLYDDATARSFEPFALTRPASELRAGAELVRRRWELALGIRASGFLGASHLAAFREFDAPPHARHVLPAGTIVANSRFAPALAAGIADAACWRHDGQVAAVRLTQDSTLAQFADGSLTLDSLTGAVGVSMGGWWLHTVWDLIRLLNEMLEADIPVMAAATDLRRDPELTVLGEHEAFVAHGAHVDPWVVADTSAGPVLVCAGARVSSFTRLVGPCVIGAHATVGGGRIASCSIGEHARVQGEMSTSIMIGYANKAHDGFVGHSVLGRWSNLGAGTITSNLKNSYGEVALWTPDGTQRTGLQFLGSLVGDHAKTGIGTRLATGCVIGAGANVFGNAMPPKFVPPFAWGDTAPFAEFALEKFLEVAERVMQRRQVVLDDTMRLQLTAAWQRRTVFSA